MLWRQASALAAVLVAASLAPQVQAPSRPPLRLAGSIDLPDVAGRIDHLSVDPAARRLFVAVLGNDTVEVLDVATGRRVHTIRGLAEPQGVLVVPGQKRLYVANGRDGSVRTFDSSSFAPLQVVPYGEDADNLRLDPVADKVWVGYGDGALGAIDAGGGKLAEVALDAHPESFQLEKGGPRVFVNLPDSRKVAVLDREKRVLLAGWHTGAATANFPMALDESGRRLFVVCRRPARLVVLNTDSGALVTELPTVGDSDDVFYDRDRKRVYISGGEGAIDVYQQEGPDQYAEIARVPTRAGGRTSLFSPELGRLFVAVRRQGAAPAAIWIYEVVE